MYIAHCYPYTYSQLLTFLQSLEKDPIRRKVFLKSKLCETIAGNSCYMLKITNFDSSPEEDEKKKGIILSARVHPGETSNSYVMEGIINFLTG